MNEIIMFVDADIREATVHIFNINLGVTYARRFESIEIDSVVPVVAKYYNVKKIIIDAGGVGKAFGDRIFRSIRKAKLLDVDVIPLTHRVLKYETIKGLCDK